MRVSSESNLAFKNQPSPLTRDRALNVIRPLPSRGKPPAIDFEVALGIRGSDTTSVSISATHNPRHRAGVLNVTVKGALIGEHALPQPVPTKRIKPRGNKSRAFARPLVAQGFVPSYLERRLTPRRVPTALVRPSAMTLEQKPLLGRARATTVFPPDDRRIFFDTAYPWSTCGQVTTPGGGASGVLVGPRHLLTVSHTIQWNDDGTAGWVRFIPMLFDTSTPFGEAWAVRTYFKRRNTDKTLGWIDEQYDYVVVVLDRAIGNLTGWMGARGYTDSWDGGEYWSHIGYPGDIATGIRPSFQTDISLNGIWYELDSHEAMSHSADVWPGQSGGPFFGWWRGEGWPSVVAVQSTQNSDENKASGGQDLVDLILEARADYP